VILPFAPIVAKEVELKRELRMQPSDKAKDMSPYNLLELLLIFATDGYAHAVTTGPVVGELKTNGAVSERLHQGLRIL
jgi:hypothetical protein